MINIPTPKITCVQVAKDVELCKQSITSFLNQSYVNKNMVIIVQGDNQIRDCIQALSQDGIYIFGALEDLTDEVLKNTLVDLASGDIICYWDDIVYHANILTERLRLLRSHKGSTTMFWKKDFNRKNEI